MAVRRTARTKKNPAQEVRQLRARIQELEDTFQAIQRGQVDAVVVNGAQGDQVFTLQGAEHPYRVLVETMNEGAATGYLFFPNRLNGTIGGEDGEVAHSPVTMLPRTRDQLTLKREIYHRLPRKHLFE